DRAGDRYGRPGRRRRHRREGARAGPGDRRREAPVRRLRGRAGGVAQGASGAVIPLPFYELRGLGRLDGTVDEITGVTIDSRRAERGDLFVAVGAGVDFVGEARARGAVTLVPDDAFAALATLARRVRERAT